jgi:hypothetical protein
MNRQVDGPACWKATKLVIVTSVLLAGCLAFWGCGGEDAASTHSGPAGPDTPPEHSATVIVPDDVPTIHEAIDSLPPEGGTVYVRAGTYEVSGAVHIYRSNVTIQGEQGTRVRLGDHVNQPVFLVGDDEPVPTVTIENVKICCIEIDGNKNAQDQEGDITRPWIMNNGIDVRKVDGLWISEIDVHDARSGGVVVSFDCSRISILESMFHGNLFDGIALYASEDIHVSDFFCYDNAAAGLSLDNDLRLVSFCNGLIRNNGTVGIFARDSEDLSFHGLTVCCNLSDGCFLSHQDTIPDTGVRRLYFEGCSFLNNGRYGLWLASPESESPNNVVVACLFSGNCSGAMEIHPEGALYQEGNVFQACSGVGGPAGEAGSDE